MEDEYFTITLTESSIQGQNMVMLNLDGDASDAVQHGCSCTVSFPHGLVETVEGSAYGMQKKSRPATWTFTFELSPPEMTVALQNSSGAVGVDYIIVEFTSAEAVTYTCTAR